MDGVRAELAAITPERRCDRLAELSALFHTAGTVQLRGRGVVAFRLDLAASAAARRAFALLRSLRLEPEIRTYRSHAFDRATRYQLAVEGTAETRGVLVEAGVLERDGRPAERPGGQVVARPCCRSAYLRGAFLGGGSLSGPHAPHLEVRTPTHAGAAFVRSVASAAGVRLRVIDRAQHAAAYAKGWDSIEGYLSVAGATAAVVALEERALVAGLRAEANRLANADHANLVRQSAAAHEQARVAQALHDAGLLDDLPVSLREAAELRLRHPTDSARELGERADPKVTKAAMARRLARLVERAPDG
ncbi:MAG: DNA-binding protein WhiA [Gaiella sp.]